MVKYMLISVFDREILTEQFESLDAARAQMREEMIQYGKVPEEVFEYGVFDDGDFGFDGERGYATDGINHSDCDWAIVPIV